MSQERKPPKKEIGQGTFKKDDSDDLSFNSSLMLFYEKYKSKLSSTSTAEEISSAFAQHMEFEKEKSQFIQQLDADDPQYFIFVEIAHKLDIALQFDTVDVTASESHHPDDTKTLEGTRSPEVGLHWLADLFLEYASTLEKSTQDQAMQKLCFLSLGTAYKKAAEARYEFDDAASQFVKTGELLIVPAMTTRHIVGVAFIGDRLIYTNTGNGCGKNSGTFIYKISDVRMITRMITGEFLKKLRDDQSMEDFDAAIKSVVSPEDFIFIPAKEQEVGNCGLSNPQKNSKGILPCLQIFIEARQAGILSGPIFLATDKISEAMKKFKAPYKQCTSLMRDQAVDMLIDACKKYQVDPKQFTNPERTKRRLIKIIATYLCKVNSDEKISLLRVEKLLAQLDTMPSEFREEVKLEKANLLAKPIKEKPIDEAKESMHRFIKVEKKI